MKPANVEAQLRCSTPASAALFAMSPDPQPGRSAATGRTGGRKPIRVLVVDDHPVVRKGLGSCLSRQENILVVGEAGDGREALRKAKELAPDIVMMDIDMPHMNGLTATELMRKELPNVKVLVLSMHTHSDVVLRILQSGARGYVIKEASSEELLRAVETVYAGEPFFSSDVARLALNQFVRGAGEGPQPGRISNREREVLIAIAEGLSNKEIASRLNVGVRTIETHRERIMRKLNIHSVAGLTRFAIQKGLIPLQKEPEH
jgi:DNA-binding NarL/FixJ family response regulator